VAKLCRSIWGLTRFFSPACRAASAQAYQTALSVRCWSLARGSPGKSHVLGVGSGRNDSGDRKLVGFGGGNFGACDPGGTAFAPVPYTETACYVDDDSLGGPKPKKKNWDFMPMALERAKEQLRTHPECEKLFGTEQTRQGDFDPSKVLDQLYNQAGGTVHGYSVSTHFLWWSPWPAFTTSRPGGGGTVLIDGSDGSYWNLDGSNGDSYGLALLLLHELGHVYNDMPGSGGSKITGDGGFTNDKSNNNNTMIFKNCF